LSAALSPGKTRWSTKGGGNRRTLRIGVVLLTTLGLPCAPARTRLSFGMFEEKLKMEQSIVLQTST
jgi:hypothetical protein